MIEKFYSFTVLCSFLVVFVLVVLSGALTRFFYANTQDEAQKERHFDLDLYKLPSHFSLQVLGIVVPILSVFTGYIVTKSVNLEIDFLLVTITIYFAVICIAAWQAFSLSSARVETSTNQLVLKWQSDKAIILATSAMYILIVLGFFFLVLFFLLQLNPDSLKTNDEDKNKTTVFLKANYLLGQSREDLFNLLGNPNQKSSNDKVWLFENQEESYELTFDDNNVISKIVVYKRKPNE